MTTELGIGREPFSTSMAVANLIWGIGAVAAGMVAHRYGAGRAVVGGTLATMAGLDVMYTAKYRFRPYGQRRVARHRRERHRHYRARGAAGRAAPPDKRIGRHRLAREWPAASAASLRSHTRRASDLSMVGGPPSLRPGRHHGLGAAVGPAARRGSPTISSLIDQQSLSEAVKEAFTQPSYQLLVTGFFVYGFHVAFYGVHLPAFVADKGLDASVGVAALTTVGLAHSVGTFIAGSPPVHREAPGD